jgi:N-acetylmuramic acid 6-phosphate etherase
MAAPNTEKLHEKAAGLDLRPLEEIAEILASGQVGAAGAVVPALAALCEGAQAMAQSLLAGGRLYYVGAGSSGLMAAADALEIGGTFGIETDRVRIVMAGGLPTSASMPGAAEDGGAGLDAGLAELAPEDTMIAVAASGSTPFTIAAAKIARSRGARVIGIANNPGSALLALADIAVLLATPAEVISGSTRLGAGTAQKIALNTMSTLMGLELGHIVDGMMVHVVADNDKLRSRAAGIVQRISGADANAAADALAQTGGDVKAAVLLARGAGSLAAAKTILETTRGHLREALRRLGER